MIDDLDGRIFSNVWKNREAFPFIRHVSNEELSKEIRTYDLMVCF